MLEADNTTQGNAFTIDLFKIILALKICRGRGLKVPKPPWVLQICNLTKINITLTQNCVGVVVLPSCWFFLNISETVKAVALV